MGVGGHPRLMRAPAQLGRSDALLVEAFDRPGVDELVYLLWSIGHLRVALGDVHDLRAGVHRQFVEALGGQRGLDRCRSVAREPVAQHRLRDVGQREFDEVADHAGVRAVLDDGGGSGVVTPSLDHSANRLVTHVERPLGGGRRRHVVVGIPQFDRRVEVAHAVVAAPLKNRRGVDVPREVEQHVAIANTRREKLVQIVASDAILLIRHALGEAVGDARAIVANVNDVDRRRRDANVADEQRNGALRDRATAKHEDSPRRLGRRHQRGGHADANVASPSFDAMARSAASNSSLVGTRSACQS